MRRRKERGVEARGGEGKRGKERGREARLAGSRHAMCRVRAITTAEVDGADELQVGVYPPDAVDIATVPEAWAH